MKNLICYPYSSSENIKVAVRIRPFLRNELGKKNIIFTDSEDDRKIKLMKNENCFEGFFDKIFSIYSTQEDVYNFVKDSINDVSEGINSTVFTYGQTGSGKTYTIFGSDWTSNEGLETYPSIKRVKNNTPHDENFVQKDFTINPFSEGNGLIPRMINQIFNQIGKVFKKVKNKNSVYCSFLQIYNEKIYDLLEENVLSSVKNFSTLMNNNAYSNGLDQKSLNIREDKVDGIYVDGLSEYIVENVYETLNLLKKGEKNRKKRFTKKNEMSSRSHTVFLIKFEGGKVNKNGNLKKAKLHLCDLAGSEKNDKEDNPKSMHFSEMVNINLSLGTLGKVIHALSIKEKYIPYRNSNLTRLLQDSLGGNTRTYFIANISPAMDNYEETVSTLKFADRAKSILTKVKPNEIAAFDDNLVNKLTKEICSLKELLSIRKKRGVYGEFEEQYTKLREENEILKKAVMSNNNLTHENIEALISENKLLKLELQKLRAGSGLEEFDTGGEMDPNSDLDGVFSHKSSNLTNLYNAGTNHKNPFSNFTTSNHKKNSNRLMLAKIGADIISSNNSNGYINNPANLNKSSPLYLTANDNAIMDIKELKSANQRLKMLEEMEKKVDFV